METLLEDLKEISAQNEELMSGKEADSASIATLETQLADYRQKYERARTELRNFKGMDIFIIHELPLMGFPSYVAIILATDQVG